MRIMFSLVMGATLTAFPTFAQDYTASSGQNSGGHWDYSNSAAANAPVESYENYPPPPTQVIISPGMMGGNSGYTGSNNAAGSSTQGEQMAPPSSGVVQGGVGWGNTGAGNVGYGNTGAGNIGVPPHRR